MFSFDATTSTTMCTLSLHDALPICAELGKILAEKLNLSTGPVTVLLPLRGGSLIGAPGGPFHDPTARSEEHTSELQSLRHLVCRLLLEQNQLSAERLAQGRIRPESRPHGLRCVL